MISRRLLLSSSVALASTSALADFNLAIRGTSPPPSPPPSGTSFPYPGQAGNLVGYQNTPASPPATWTAGNPNGGSIAGQWTAPAWPGAYPGSLGAAVSITGGSAGSPQVIAFKNMGTVSLTVPYVIFVGCQFSGGPGDILAYGGVNGYHIGFFYCTFKPSAVSVIPFSSWPNATAGAGGWPCSGAGGGSSGVITAAQGYDYGIATTTTTTWQDWLVDHCDAWGGADIFDHASALDNPNVVGPVSYQDCWAHDCRSDSGGDHTDGIGNLQDSSPNNMVVNHCTIASPGANTSALAMQGGNPLIPIYMIQTGLQMTNNYLTGWDHLIQTTFPPYGNLQDSVCTGNPIANDLNNGGVNYDMSGTWLVGTYNSLWRNNKVYCVPGYPDSTIGGTSSLSINGYYSWPDTSYHLTDYTG